MHTRPITRSLGRLILAGAVGIVPVLALGGPAQAANDPQLTAVGSFECNNNTRSVKWSFSNTGFADLRITAVQSAGLDVDLGATQIPRINRSLTDPAKNRPGTIDIGQSVGQDATTATVSFDYVPIPAGGLAPLFPGDPTKHFELSASAGQGFTCGQPPSTGRQAARSNGGTAGGGGGGTQPGAGQPANAPAGDQPVAAGAAPADPNAPLAGGAPLAEVPSVDLPNAGQPPVVDIPALGQADTAAGAQPQAAPATAPVSRNASQFLFGAAGLLVIAGTIIFLVSRRRRAADVSTYRSR